MVFNHAGVVMRGSISSVRSFASLSLVLEVELASEQLATSFGLGGAVTRRWILSKLSSRKETRGARVLRYGTVAKDKKRGILDLSFLV